MLLGVFNLEHNLDRNSYESLFPFLPSRRIELYFYLDIRIEALFALASKELLGLKSDTIDTLLNLVVARQKVGATTIIVGLTTYKCVSLLFEIQRHRYTYAVERTEKAPAAPSFSIFTRTCSPGLPTEATRTWQVIGLLDMGYIERLCV